MIFSLIKNTFKDFYWSLFCTILILMIVGVIFIHAASYSSNEVVKPYALKQSIWLGIGLVFMLGIVSIGYRSFLNISYLIYLCSLFLLILVFFVGTSKYGAQRWIPIAGFALQPSEFAKIAVILTLSHYLGNRKKTRFQLKRFFIVFLLTCIPLFLIVKQPDLGTSLIFLPILYCMLFVWGVKLRYIFFTVFMGIASFPIFWHLLKDYQKKRLLTFINVNEDPLGASYTAIQSKIAVGSGGIFGKGLYCGTQNRLNFVPEHHTDFIFCVIAEEGGFIASMSLIILFLIVIKLSIDVITKTTDPEAKLLAAGITSMLIFQIIINIGMTIGLCPITGLPLPFISYGGSSLLTYCIGFGFIMSIYKQRKIF